jgi:Ribbon-helix-helix domain
MFDAELISHSALPAIMPGPRPSKPLRDAPDIFFRRRSARAWKNKFAGRLIAPSECGGHAPPPVLFPDQTHSRRLGRPPTSDECRPATRKQCVQCAFLRDQDERLVPTSHEAGAAWDALGTAWRWLAGHKTSVSLEDEFWNALKDIAASRHTAINGLWLNSTQSASTGIYRRRLA